MTPAAPAPVRGRGRGCLWGRGCGPAADGSLFNLRVRMADQAEEYPNVTLGKQRNVRNVVETVNQASTLVTLAEGQATGPLADRAPEAGTYVLRSEAAALVPAVEPKDFVGQIDRAQRGGGAGDRGRRDHGLLPGRDGRATRPAPSTGTGSRRCSWR